MAVKEPTGDLKKACWKGYTAVGMKNKNGRKVPNCVPVKEESNEPKDREEGTTKLAKRYKKDTPGQCDCMQKEGYVKAINKKAKNLQNIMKGRKKLGDVDPSKTWQQNRADALKAGRAMGEEVDQMDEAHKLNSPVEIIKGPRKGIKGHVGEIRQSYKGGPKTYTVYHGDHGAIQVGKEDIRAMKEETTGVQKHIVAVTLSDPSVKSADKIFKKIAVRASDEDEAKKRAIKFYRKAGYKVHDAYHHSVVTVLNKEEAEQMDESFVGRETKDGVWRVFKSGNAAAVAGPFKSSSEASAWIKSNSVKEEVDQMDETKDMTKALTKKIEAKGKYTTYRDKDGLLKLKKLKKEEVEQMDEKAMTGNENRGAHGELGASDKKYSAMHTKVKKIVGAAGHLADVKKPNVIVKHYLDSVRGRHAVGRSDGYIERDFGKFKKKYNPDQMDEASYDSLGLRSLHSANPQSQPNYAYKTQKGKVAAAKKNVPDLKATIKSSLGKHPKPNLPEEVEQMDEISKKTLASYVKKAAPQLATSLMTAATTKDIADAEFHGKRYAKRQKGINKAVDKLAKEEVEQKAYNKALGRALKKMSEGYGAYAPKRYGSREDDWGHEPPDRDDKKFRFSGQTKNSWSHVYVNGEKVKEFHGASSHDDAAEHAYELLHKHKKAGQNHKIEIHDHSQPNTKIRVDEMNGIAKQPKAGVEKLVSKINPDKGAKVVKETRNVIREVIKKAVDKQETNKANGKTATGEPMPKVKIDPVISLDSNKGI